MSKSSFKKFLKLLIPKMTRRQLLIVACLEVIVIVLVGLLYLINSDGRLALLSSLLVLLISEDVFEYFGSNITKPVINKNQRRIIRILWLNTVVSVEMTHEFWNKISSTDLMHNFWLIIPIFGLVAIFWGIVTLGELIIVRGVPAFKKLFQNSEE